jgi:hypothetical protein
MSVSWSTRTARLVGATLVAGLVTGVPGGAAQATDLVPITQRAIASVVLEHAPTDTTRREAAPITRFDPKGALGADLRYHGDAVNDGDLLRTSITPAGVDLACGGSPHCVVLADGAERVTLRWNVEDPGVEPGMVLVTAEHGTEFTAVIYSCPGIAHDPRTLPLEIPVQTLVDIATDPRLRLLTTQEVVDAGAAVTDWLGGEPDPDAWDRVPQTDLGQIAGMLIDHGGYAYYRGPRVSPLKERFGPDAVGGRVDRRWLAPADPSVLDLVAAPTVPSWLTDRPCATGAYAAHCVRFSHARGPVFLMWRPARGSHRGVVWAVQLRAGSVVAMRTSGRRVPVSAAAVKAKIAWWGLVRPTVRSPLVGMTTEKRVVDFDLGLLGG